MLKTGYDLTYAYNPARPQQVGTIADTGYRTEGTIVKQGKSQSYSYDANGNMLCVNTTQAAPDGTPRLANSRRLLWDEENRLLAVSDNGFVSNYWYDASGERTLKMSGEGEGVLVNGILSGGRTGTSKYTAYVNPYLVITNGGQMSKHFYIGSQRVVSQLCSSGSMFDATKNPQTTAKAAASKVDYTAKYDSLTSKVKTRFDSLGVAYHGKDNGGVGFWAYSTPVNETDQYYYHPDHLGSSSLITNLGGDLVQHIEYVPFGKVFVEERTSTWGVPFKFNAKELDEETGLYYYVHRYMDPRTSVWLSVDPLAEKYPGVSPYVYCLNNPVNAIDPDGRVVIASFNKKTGRLAIIDRDQYKSGLPTVFVGAKDYKINGIRDKKGNLTQNQVLIVDNVFTGGHSDGKEVVTGDITRPNEKPISKGEYSILENKGNTNPDHASFFVLDPKDNSPYDKVDNRPGETNSSGQKRSGYNLHPGRISWGCVTINKDDPNITPEQRAEEWNVVNSVIGNTSSEQVPDRRGMQKYIPFTTQKKYGTLKVTN